MMKIPHITSGLIRHIISTKESKRSLVYVEYRNSYNDTLGLSQKTIAE